MKIQNSILISTLCLLGGLAQAQQAPRPVPSLPVPGQITAPQPQPEQPLRFDLDFPGGNIVELIAAVSRVTEPVNVVIPTRSRTVAIPAFSVRDVTIGALFGALSTASTAGNSSGPGWGGGMGRSIQPASGSPAKQGNSVPFQFVLSNGPGSPTIWSFVAADPQASSGSPSPEPERERVCRYYNLSTFLGKYTIEDITATITSGYEMMGEHSKAPLLKFHPGTGLLIAVGQSEQMKVIDSALEALRQNPSAYPFAPKTTSGKPVEN